MEVVMGKIFPGARRIFVFRRGKFGERRESLLY
jgi:hypothetical protein